MWIVEFATSGLEIFLLYADLWIRVGGVESGCMLPEKKNLEALKRYLQHSGHQIVYTNKDDFLLALTFFFTIILINLNFI